MARDGTVEIAGVVTGELQNTRNVTGYLSTSPGGGTGSGEWGKITGNIEDQADLQVELAKRDNKIEIIKQNGVEQPIVAKAVNIRATDAVAATVQEVEAILYLG